MSRLEEQDFDEKRLARRQKRKKSQLIAYISLAVMILLVVGAAVFGIISIKNHIGNRKDKGSDMSSADMAASDDSREIVIETPETTDEPEEMTQDDILDEVVSDVLNDMTIEDKAAGLFIISPEQLTGVATAVKAGSGTQDALSRYAVGGIVYSAKNIKTAEQITEMLSATASMSKYPIFTVTREWGEGVVNSAIGLDGITDVTDADTAAEAGTVIANALYKYGFNFDISPNMDITDSGVWGTDVNKVKDITASFTEALQSSGVFACAYSFPKAADTESQMQQLDDSAESLATNEYTLFKNVIDDGNVAAIMLSNASFPNIVGDNTPASLSSVMIEDELRGVLGFDGIVITGALDDKAITDYYTPDQAAIAAIKAGADMIYMPEDFETAVNGIIEAVESGDISESRIDESLIRIYKKKYAGRVEEISKSS